MSEKSYFSIEKIPTGYNSRYKLPDKHGFSFVKDTSTDYPLEKIKEILTSYEGEFPEEIRVVPFNFSAKRGKELEKDLESLTKEGYPKFLI
ncbi:hypothetical protein CL617_03145 [archaeon]|nr:hypothetical protein [archaeon]|tara:strand:+ start:35267 stop:35539 length:273 start_codon:yes stop_codon:yes gene_type:complete